MIKQSHFLGDRFHARPEFSALGQEIVIGVDQQDRGT